MVHYRIKELIAAKKKTQKEVAEQMGISTTSLSRIITNDQKPSLDTLERLADVLNVGVADLFADGVQTAAPSIICPHCGHRIELEVKEKK